MTSYHCPTCDQEIMTVSDVIHEDLHCPRCHVGMDPGRPVVPVRQPRLPRTATTLERIQQIVATKQNARVDGARVDLFTASAILRVYDALNATNRLAFERLRIRSMARIAFKMLRAA